MTFGMLLKFSFLFEALNFTKKKKKKLAFARNGITVTIIIINFVTYYVKSSLNQIKTKILQNSLITAEIITREKRQVFACSRLLNLNIIEKRKLINIIYHLNTTLNILVLQLINTYKIFISL